MIQHTFPPPLYNNMLPEKKHYKLLEWILIKYIHKYNDYIFIAQH